MVLRYPVSRRSPQAATALDFVAVTSLLGAFTVALMNREYVLTNAFQTVKWYFYAAFVTYAFFRNARNLRGYKSLAAPLFLALPLVGTISTLAQSMNMLEGVQRILSFALLFALAFFLPVPPDPRERVRLWVKSLLYVNGAVIAFSMVLAADPRYYHQGRFRGCMEHVNYLAASASVFALGMLGYVLVGLPKLRLLPLVGVAGGVYCLVASGARADLLATAVAAIVLTLGGMTRRNALLVLAGSGAVGSVLYSANAIINIFAPAPVLAREFILSDRTVIWARQINAFLANPVIGWGLEFNGANYGIGRAGGEGSYTDLLSAVGLLGAVPFFAGIFYCMYRYAKLLSPGGAGLLAGKQEKTVFLNGFAILVYILVTSIAEGWLAAVGTPIAVFTWVVLAAAAMVKPTRLYLRTVEPAWVPRVAHPVRKYLNA